MNKKAWKYYFDLYKADYPSLFFSIAISILKSLFVLPIVLIIKRVVDTILPKHQIQYLIYAGLALMLLTVLGAIITLWTKKTTLKLIKKVVQRLREELLSKVYSLSRSFYNQADRSSLHNIIIQDTSRVEEMSSALVTQMLPSLVISIALSAVLIYLNWFLYLILVLITPFIVWVGKTMGQKVKEVVNAFRHSLESLNRDVWFALWLADLTILQTAEKQEIERQKKNFDDFRIIGTSMTYLQTAFNVAQSTIIGVSGIIILIVGGITVLNKGMTLGDLLSFYVAAGLLRKHVNPVLGAIPTLISGGESIEELYNFICNPNVNPYSGTRKIDFNGNISIRRVHFKYEEKSVLNNVSINLKEKSIVAIVGPNGSGKSTIVNLILGFYKPQDGGIFAEDVSYEVLDMIHLRRQIGVVPQAPLLFPGSIWENIVYGSEEVNSNEVYLAARISTANEFIDRLPEGYASFVGDNGVKLSGGERQRIAIARALLRKPKLLILDEPTNHLDKDATHALIKNLKGMPELPTTIIISHQKNIIQEAQQVYLIEGGEVIKDVPYLN